MFAKALTTDKGINYTNMVLMVISTALAFIIPFQLFLFVYAVLGPLHYLTEISWLDKRNFFIEKKSDIWLYVLMALLLTIAVFDTKSKTNLFATTFVITAFFYTLIIFFVKNNAVKYGLTVVVFLMSYAFKADRSEFTLMWFGIMLPTLIHVFVFTGLFILYGALKNKSTTGILSIAVFVACAASFFIFSTSQAGTTTDPTVIKNMDFFTIMNKALLYLFGMDGVTTMRNMFDYSHDAIFTSPAALVVARFIAFAYTYHYLNWFSKTTVIKWHEVSKTRLIVIASLWIASVAIYFINYSAGFKVLFLLSMLHVFFEFPLNIQTIKGIGKELRPSRK